MAVFLAVDLGTSFIKGAVIDLANLSLRHVQRIPFPGPIPGLPARFHEVPPDSALAAMRELLGRLLPLAPDCAGLVMCSQMQGLVLTDESGRPLSNCITWRDQRALEPHPSGRGSYFDVLCRRLTEAQRRALGELHPSLPFCALFWLAEQGRLPAGAVPASLPDFVLAALSEARTPPGVEATNASMHGPLDLETLAWREDILAAWGLERLRWPQVQRAGDVVGELMIGGRSIPCYAPVGDQPCSLVGALLQTNELSINISTGSQVSLIAPRLARGDYQTRPFFDGKYLNLITHVPAGRALDRLVALLGELAEAEGYHLRDPWSTIGRAAEAAGPTDLRVNLAFFSSLGGDRGEIANIREDNLSVGTLFRAAFQDMAGHYRDCARRLSPERAWRRIVFSGGLAVKVGILRDVICEQLDAGYRLCPSSEDALFGLLALALAFSGRADSVEQAIGVLAQRVAEIRVEEG